MESITEKAGRLKVCIVPSGARVSGDNFILYEFGESDESLHKKLDELEDKRLEIERMKIRLCPTCKKEMNFVTRLPTVWSGVYVEALDSGYMCPDCKVFIDCIDIACSERKEEW